MRPFPADEYLDAGTPADASPPPRRRPLQTVRELFTPAPSSGSPARRTYVAAPGVRGESGGSPRLEAKGGALAGRGLGPDPSTVRFDDCAGDRQAEAAAAAVAGAALVGAVEALEDVLELVVRDAGRCP